MREIADFDFRAPLSGFNAHGVEFLVVGASAMAAEFADLLAPVLSARHLIENKRAMGRTQDLADVEWLGGCESRSPARVGDLRTFENLIVPVSEAIDVSHYDTVIV